MDIQKIKLELLKIILENDSSEFIQRVADFVIKEQPDFWTELSDAEQKEIQKGTAELDQGKRTIYESFLKKTS